MTAVEPLGGTLSELNRARAETVLRGGCLEALRVAVDAAGYPVALVRDRNHLPDRLWVEAKVPGTRPASIAVGCVRAEDGWWFIQPPDRRLGRVDDLDDVICEIARRFVMEGDVKCS